MLACGAREVVRFFELFDPFAFVMSVVHPFACAEISSSSCQMRNAYAEMHMPLASLTKHQAPPFTSAANASSKCPVAVLPPARLLPVWWASKWHVATRHCEDNVRVAQTSQHLKF